MLVFEEIPKIAAEEWAKAHAPSFRPNPIEFGHAAAKVFLACRETLGLAGDEKATAAALAALSVRPEVLQLISQLSELRLPTGQGMSQTAAPASEGSAL